MLGQIGKVPEDAKIKIIACSKRLSPYSPFIDAFRKWNRRRAPCWSQLSPWCLRVQCPLYCSCPTWRMRRRQRQGSSLVVVVLWLMTQSQQALRVALVVLLPTVCRPCAGCPLTLRQAGSTHAPRIAL